MISSFFSLLSSSSLSTRTSFVASSCVVSLLSLLVSAVVLVVVYSYLQLPLHFSLPSLRVPIIRETFFKQRSCQSASVPSSGAHMR